MFAELVQDRCAVDAEVLADSGEGPAHAVEVDCLAHLLGCQATAAHRHLMVMQDPADRFPLDPEPFSQLVYGCPGFVTRDQVLNLNVVEMTCRTDRFDI
ncbi:hypothetical protein [Nocardia flavorosea]|uniref:hypothetical protein n=1 Tax=Nocardia flavorosea TaxID=53429 RepID=UPI002458671F|nr:hypothetical protein [Nocardia flavorosea]